MTIETLILNAYKSGELVGATITTYGAYIPLKVSGVGYTIRATKDSDNRDYFYLSKRDDSFLKLEQEVVGLPIIINHPLDTAKENNENSRRFLTLNNFKDNAIIGTCLNAYEKDNELWALAKIYDIDVVLDLLNNNKSTSPAVYCYYEKENAVIVDKPMLINHLAIVEQGHWDRKDSKSIDNSRLNILDLKDSKMKQALQDNSISPCLVDDYRYLNKGIPNFFDYNIKDKNEAKERQDEKENLKSEIEEDKQDSDELKHSEIDTKDTPMSEPLETLDKDKQAMAEAIKRDIEKDKENLARVEADKDEKGYEKDDDKKAQKLDKEIAKDEASGNDDKLYEEDDRVKRDKERDDALRDKEKAKDDACMVRADEDTISDDDEYGDDDKLRDEILGVMEELCDTLNDSLNFKKVVCMKREKPTYLANRLLKRNLALCDEAYRDMIRSDKLKELGTAFTKKVFNETIQRVRALNDEANKQQKKRHEIGNNGWVTIEKGVSFKAW